MSVLLEGKKVVQLEMLNDNKTEDRRQMEHEVMEADTEACTEVLVLI